MFCLGNSYKYTCNLEIDCTDILCTKKPIFAVNTKPRTPISYVYWPARAPTIDSLLVARIPRASSIVLAGAHLILLVLGLLAAIPTIASIANLIALLPRAGDRGGRGRCRPRKVCLHLRLAQLGQLVPHTAAGSIAILGIRLLVLDDGLAFLDGRVLAASGPVEDTKTPGGRLEYAYMYRFQLPCRIHARTKHKYAITHVCVTSARTTCVPTSVRARRNAWR